MNQSANIMASNNLTIEDYKSSENLLQLADKDGDGTLDPFELHSVLIEKGILVPLDVVTQVFDEHDSDDNGLLTIQEFASFAFKTDESKYAEFQRRLWSDTDWWFVLLYFTGGIMFLLGGFHVELGIPASSLKNIYLAGTVMYIIGTLRYIIPFLHNQYKAQESFERTATSIQTELRAKAERYISIAESTDEVEPTRSASAPVEVVKKKKKKRRFKFSFSGNKKKTKKILSDPATSSQNDIETTESSTNELAALFTEPVSKEDAKLEIYMREVIFANTSSEITKTQLQMALLKEVGVVTQTFRDRIHKVLDKDDDDKISVEEFISFVRDWDIQMTDSERWQYVLKSSFTNLSYILSLIFCTGMTIGILNNIAKRYNPDGLWAADIFTPGLLSATCSTIGSTIFIAERIIIQGEKFDMEEVVRDMLRKLIEDFDEDEKLHTESKEVEAFNDDVEFNKSRFNLMLEQNGVFMPKFQVKVLFEEIDDDDDDAITKSELSAFTSMKRNRIIAFFKECTNIIFLIYVFWDLGRIIGTACSIVISTVHHHNELIEIAIKIRAITFFFAGTFMVVTAIDTRLLDLKYRDNMRKAIFALDKDNQSGSQASYGSMS